MKRDPDAQTELAADDVLLSPRQRWGTCCPFDPECEHSFLTIDELMRWMDTPICAAEAEYWEGAE